MKSLPNLLDKLWQDYQSLNPQAHRIHSLLEARGETLRNDHIAFRTLAIPKMNIQAMVAPFLELGYLAAGQYLFPEKKLVAKHFEHPDPTQPKIFISELLLHELSQGARSMLLGLVNQISPTYFSAWDWCVGGRPWPIDFTTYEALERESDYAAWLSAFGFRANHFTVLTNNLKTFPHLVALNDFLKSNGFALNESGGEIKGTPAQYLEQSSTLANPVETLFLDGKHAIPGCYYEFARRYLMPNGNLFQGFNATSANRIFESTDRTPR